MPKLKKPLTDVQVRNAKPKEKDYKLPDGDNLYLVVKANGSKLWRMNYYRPVTKKQNTLAFGAYPEISLADARQKREEARKLLAAGTDPAEQRKSDQRAAKVASGHTFKAVALEWLAKQIYTDDTREAAHYIFEIPFQQFGHKPIADILPIDVLDACRMAEANGHREKARKMRIKCGQVFRYAVASSLCLSDPTRDLRGALAPKETQHLAAVVDPAELKQLLIDIDNYNGRGRTIYALKLAPILFVRPGELRHMRWDQLDLDAGHWNFVPPKTRRTTRVAMVIPLPRQAIDILKQVKVIAENKKSLSEFVFPAIHSSVIPMSENTINQALRRMGWESDQVCGHGFRATAKTILGEVLEYHADLTEMQLGHQVKDSNGRAYNRMWMIKQRTAMMQAWADYLDKLKAS